MESQKYPWLSTFLSYFKTIKQYDTKIESFRFTLSSIQDFSPNTLFSYLDKNSKSFLTLNDFKSFLSSEKIIFDETKLRKLIHNFDKDGDFSLNLDEFSCLVQPKMKKIKDEFNSNNKTELSEEIKNNFKNILEKEMELIHDLNDISKKIINSEIFSSYEAFTLIVGDDKYITQKNLGKFLNENYCDINDEEVEQIMFRIDADNDDKISYEEFKEIFFPLKDELPYNNKNINNNEIANKYLIEEEKEKNEDINFNINDNEDEDDNYIRKKENNKMFEEEDETGKKKKKITKKTILKPQLKSNLNSELNNNNLFSSQNKINKDDDLFENKYIGKGKCTNCDASKKYIKTTYIYDNEFENDNNKNFFEEKKNYIDTNDILIEKNKNDIFPSTNKYNNKNKKGNCKACQYTAENIYSDLRIKNCLNSPFIPNDNNNFNKKEENEEENIILKSEKNNLEQPKKEIEIEENGYDIYKNKDELLKKYGIYTDVDNKKNKENDIDISNFMFSTQKKVTYVRDNNYKNENINNIDNYLQENNYKNKDFKSKNQFFSTKKNDILETNFSSNYLSNPQRINTIQNNDINEKKNLLYKLFLNFIEKETELKKIKESLSSCPDANPQNIFDLFNINKSNKITSSDILKTLNSLSSNEVFDKNDMKYIFKKYNKTMGNGFTLYDLKNILFNDQVSLDNDEINLEEKTKNIILEFFKEVIEGEKGIENSRIELNKVTNNIYFDLFKAIKNEDKLGIEKDDIYKFMKENEYNAKEEDIDIIFEKMDKNKDNLIDYSEFIDEIKSCNFC